MTATVAYQQATELSKALGRIRERLDEEEREHLALELLDATRRGNGYEHVLVPWLLTVLVREHPDYGWQVKEFRNLEASGDLLAGAGVPRDVLAEPRRVIELCA